MCHQPCFIIARTMLFQHGRWYIYVASLRMIWPSSHIISRWMEQSLFKFYRILTVVYIYIYIYWKWFWLISEPIEYKKVVTDEFKVSPPIILISRKRLSNLMNTHTRRQDIRDLVVDLLSSVIFSFVDDTDKLVLTFGISLSQDLV